MTHVEAWGAEYGALDEYIFELPGPGDVWQEQQNAILWSTNSREESPHGDIAMQLFNNNLLPGTTAPNTSSVNQCVNEWPGDFGFSAVIASTPKAGKNVNWTYSEKLRKLYAVVNAACPIKFVTDRAPPEGSFVCAVAVFRESESRRENVLRCPAHRTPEDALDAGARVDQWFHCDHPQAQNCCDMPNGGRYCVRLPLGTEPFSLTFGCRNSCPGGLRRRATEMVFLLQSPEGLDLARSVVQVKVCACPGRDRRHDEQQGEDESAQSRQPAPLCRQRACIETPTGQARTAEEKAAAVPSYYASKVEKCTDFCISFTSLSRSRMQRIHQNQMINQTS
nr:LOW QUALITY PROTEIN: cellular tumor antigen p53-like [Rhipicephalus microplus]